MREEKRDVGGKRGEGMKEERSECGRERVTEEKWGGGRVEAGRE